MLDQKLKTRIDNFVSRLEREDICMHGFMLSVGGEVKATAYYAPFEEGKHHRMYSISKTMTAVAIGILMDEGKLGLDDHIVEYFTDYLPENPDGRLMRLTIRDMLRRAWMRTGRSPSSPPRPPMSLARCSTMTPVVRRCWRRWCGG